MLWTRIGCKLVVKIIIFQDVYQLLYQNSIHIKPAKVISWVVYRKNLMLGLLVEVIASLLDQFAYFIHVIAAVLALVPDVADNQSLSCKRWYQSILKEEHHSVQIGHLNQQSLSLLVEQYCL